MSRNDLRNRYPWHADAQQRYAAHQSPAKPYDRHSFRHRLRAFWARVRLALGA